MAFTHELAVQVVGSIPGYVTDSNGLRYAGRRHRPGHEGDRGLRGNAGDAELALRPVARRQTPALIARGGRGYEPVQGAAAARLPQRAGGRRASFQRMGVVEPYRTENPRRGGSRSRDSEADRFTFKVPTLRNVELTYPYFHDGAPRR